MDNNIKLQGLILGHSFVRKVQHSCYSVKDYTLHLDNVFHSIMFRSIPGCCLSDLNTELDWIKEAQPNIVLLGIGSNDLCDTTVTERVFVNQLWTFTRELSRYVQKVFVSNVWFRAANRWQNTSADIDAYNDKVAKTNHEFGLAFSNNPRGPVFLYHSKVIWTECVSLLEDGIHPNAKEFIKCQQNYRGALKLASKHIY